MFALLTEGVTMIENKRPDWLLQYYKHCQKLIKVGSYCSPVPVYSKLKLSLSEDHYYIDDVAKCYFYHGSRQLERPL